MSFDTLAVSGYSKTTVGCFPQTIQVARIFFKEDPTSATPGEKMHYGGFARGPDGR
jgi:hypothetical protein